MGLIQRDLEEITSNKANEIAEQRYGREFSDLPASLQMLVWMDAEKEVADEIADQGDAIYERIREQGFNHRKDGDDHWAELELMRRLGK